MSHAVARVGCVARVALLKGATSHAFLRGGGRSLNEDATEIVETNVEGSSRISAEKGLNGSGIVIGLSDSGLDVSHCHFRDDAENVTFARLPESFVGTSFLSFESATHRKVAQYVAFLADTEDLTGHGTYVGSILSGASSASSDALRHAGLAFGARLAFADLGNRFSDAIWTPPLDDWLFPSARSAGARVHSASWGASSSAYTAQSEQADAFLFSHVDSVAVFSAGNDGADGAGSVSSPASAKNVVSVGALNASAPGAPMQVRPQSGRGPTLDGRLKPTVVAPGSQTAAAMGSGCGFGRLKGTSAAAPLVSGAVAVMQQYFQEGYYPSGAAAEGDALKPMGPLLVAMLAIGAQDIGGGEAFPGNAQGFGRFQLSEALSFADDASAAVAEPKALFADGAFDGNCSAPAAPSACPRLLRAGESRAYGPFEVDGAFRVALAWYDAPGEELLRDLDLRVEGPGGALAVNGLAPGERDAANTVERVAAEGLSGAYTVTVSAAALPPAGGATAQPFALAVAGDFRRTPRLFPSHAPRVDRVEAEGGTLHVRGERLSPEGGAPAPLRAALSCAAGGFVNASAAAASPTEATVAYDRAAASACPGDMVLRLSACARVVNGDCSFFDSDDFMFAMDAAAPSAEETAPPSNEVTAAPSNEVTAPPSIEDTAEPSIEDTAEPSIEDTAEPSIEDTAEPSIEDTAEPSKEDTAEPSVQVTLPPSAVDSPPPSVQVTLPPSVEGTPQPSEEVTPQPSEDESPPPSADISPPPSAVDTSAPSATSTLAPSSGDTSAPSAVRSPAPTVLPSALPTATSPAPSSTPTVLPSALPTATSSAPTLTAAPSPPPSALPSFSPTEVVSFAPSGVFPLVSLSEADCNFGSSEFYADGVLLPRVPAGEDLGLSEAPGAAVKAVSGRWEQEFLPAGRHIRDHPTAAQLLGADNFIELREATALDVVTIKGGAGFYNALGYMVLTPEDVRAAEERRYDFLEDAVRRRALHIFAPNAKGYARGASTRLLYYLDKERETFDTVFPKGARIVFFLLPDAWSGCTYECYGKLREEGALGDGSVVFDVDNVLFAMDALNDPALREKETGGQENGNRGRQFIMYRDAAVEPPAYVFSAEDIKRDGAAPEGDSSFSDVAFYLQLSDAAVANVPAAFTLYE